MSFWDIFWFIIISYAFIAYLMLLFSIFGDLFRDRETSGWLKGVWIVALVFLPLLSSLVYLVVRGRGMADRSLEAADRARRQQEGYIREVAGTPSSTDQIARARAMLDAGTISESEYATLTAKALA